MFAQLGQVENASSEFCVWFLIRAVDIRENMSWEKFNIISNISDFKRRPRKEGLCGLSRTKEFQFAFL